MGGAERKGPQYQRPPMCPKRKKKKEVGAHEVDPWKRVGRGYREAKESLWRRRREGMSAETRIAGASTKRGAV